MESLPSYEPGPDTDTEICQTAEALEDLGPEGLQRLTDELSEEYPLEGLRTCRRRLPHAATLAIAQSDRGRIETHRTGAIPSFRVDLPSAVR